MIHQFLANFVVTHQDDPRFRGFVMRVPPNGWFTMEIHGNSQSQDRKLQLSSSRWSQRWTLGVSLRRNFGGRGSDIQIFTEHLVIDSSIETSKSSWFGIVWKVFEDLTFETHAFASLSWDVRYKLYKFILQHQSGVASIHIKPCQLQQDSNF